MRRTFPAAALAILVTAIAACTTDRTSPPSDPAAELAVLAYGQNLIAALNDPPIVPGTVRIATRPCTGSAPDEGSYRITGEWQLSLPADRHTSALQVAVDFLQSQGHYITSSTDDPPELQGGTPANGFTFTITSQPPSMAVHVDTGCTPGGQGGSEAAPPVRTDTAPIAARFPHLGDFPEVHWQGSVAATATGRVPGPTDVRIQALVKLDTDTFAAAAAHYQWMPAPGGSTVLIAGLSRYALPGAAWKVNQQFTEDVCGARYGGVVYLDSANGIVFLDVIGR